MSHLLPAGGYRRLRDLSEPGQHPVVINTEVTYEASWQAQDYLLCRVCEQLFGRNGEDWVPPNCAGKDVFPLHAHLTVAPPTLVTPQKLTLRRLRILRPASSESVRTRVAYRGNIVKPPLCS
jgi:hypothetical protein